MRLLVAAAVLVATGSGAAANPSPPASCGNILPPAPLHAGSRPLLPEDLVRLRDIGPVDPEPWAAPFFTISPDGGRAALQLRQADPASNTYCLAMAVVDLSHGAPARIVDRGGDVLLLTIENRGLAGYPTGIISPVTPRWSPDGRWIAFLKRTAGTTQVWRAMADGSGSGPLTHSPVDVVDFRIGADGGTIVFATQPGFGQARRENEREGRTGFHFDERFWPFARNRPFARAPIAREVQALDPGAGQIRAPTTAEAALVSADHQLIATAGAAPGGREGALWISATNLKGGARSGSLHARLANGSTVTCSKPACEGAARPWWMPGHARVRFFRREGWARASTAIYEWIPANQSVRRIYLTDDVLADCAPTGPTLVCLLEGSLQPRRLEQLDPASGARRPLFDPNPEFSRLTLGSVRRLRWRNLFGLETLADLVLPVGYRKGERYPLIVVQYDTRGFLRGGTGDEYPIQAFANRGYAVLSFHRPEAIGDIRKSRDFKESRRSNLEYFADRRSVESSLEAGIRLAVEAGIADSKRIGITGLSDGSSTATWALLHSSMFAAAVMSTCCIDTTLTMRVGPGVAKDFRSVGYPGLLERDTPFWNQISFARNARNVRIPILMQLADDEYLDSLESFTALREAGAPADMFVFPDEHHVKWQPAHRLAIYRRSLDWFDYWLRGIRSEAADRLLEIREWDKLRSGGGRASAN
jgi:dipeptidyl aminopeptidase/acylaminoacyl peptidase